MRRNVVGKKNACLLDWECLPEANGPLLRRVIGVVAARAEPLELLRFGPPDKPAHVGHAATSRQDHAATSRQDHAATSRQDHIATSATLQGCSGPGGGEAELGGFGF